MRQTKVNVESEEALLENAAVDAYESVITDVDGEDDGPGSEEIRWLRHERLMHKSLHWTKRPSVIMIAVVGFLTAFAIGFSMAAKVELIMRLLCRSIQNVGLDSEVDMMQCNKAQVQILLSRMESYISLISGLIAMAVSGYIGQLSDIYGRKCIIVANMTTLLIGFVLQTMLLDPAVSYFHKNWIIASACVHSLVGGVHAIFSTGFSYIIDTVDEEQRIYSLGIFTAAISIGMALGPAVSSQMIKYVFNSPLGCFRVSIGLLMAAILFALVILPESRSVRSRKRSREDSISANEQRALLLAELKGQQKVAATVVENIKSFFSPLRLLWLPTIQEDGSHNYRPRITLVLLVVTDVLWGLCTYATVGTTAFYATYRFGLGAVGLGYYISVSSGARAFALTVLSPIVLHFIKKHFSSNKYQIDSVDLCTMRFSYLFQVAGTLMMIFATDSFQFLAAAAIEGVNSLYIPAVRGAMVKYAPNGSTGAMMGALSSIEGLTNLIGPPAFTSIYSLTVETEPRTYLFIILGMLVACGSILFPLSSSTEKISLGTDREEA